MDQAGLYLLEDVLLAAQLAAGKYLDIDAPARALLDEFGELHRPLMIVHGDRTNMAQLQIHLRETETNIYDIAAKKLVWTGLTETEIGGQVDAQIGEFVQLLTATMSRDKLL